MPSITGELTYLISPFACHKNSVLFHDESINWNKAKATLS